MLLDYVTSDSRSIVGLKTDSVVMVIDCATGQSRDSVVLDRKLVRATFFATEQGSTLNVAAQHGDTVFIYKLGMPTAVNPDPDATILPVSFALQQNYPNPFNPTTAIEFDLPVAGHAQLTVYNVLGQQVATLLDRDLPAGTHSVTWDSRDEGGKNVSSGVYLYRLESGDHSQTRKMILLK